MLGRTFQRLHLGLSTHELRQPASRRALQPGSKWSEAHHLINVDRLAHAFDPGRTQRLELKISFDEFARLLAYRDCPCSRERLQARGQVRGGSYSCEFNLPGAGRDLANYDFAGVHANANLYR